MYNRPLGVQDRILSATAKKVKLTKSLDVQLYLAGSVLGKAQFIRGQVFVGESTVISILEPKI